MWRDQVVVSCYQVDCRYYAEIRFGTLGPVHFNGDLAIIFINRFWLRLRLYRCCFFLERRSRSRLDLRGRCNFRFKNKFSVLNSCLSLCIRLRCNRILFIKMLIWCLVLWGCTAWKCYCWMIYANTFRKYTQRIFTIHWILEDQFCISPHKFTTNSCNV